MRLRPILLLFAGGLSSGAAVPTSGSSSNATGNASSPVDRMSRQAIIEDWLNQKKHFVKVMPIDYKRALKELATEQSNPVVVSNPLPDNPPTSVN